MMKRLSAVLACFLLAFCCLTTTGCGSKEPTVIGEGTELPPQMTPEEEAEYFRQMEEMSKY